MTFAHTKPLGFRVELTNVMLSYIGFRVKSLFHVKYSLYTERGTITEGLAGSMLGILYTFCGMGFLTFM